MENSKLNTTISQQLALYKVSVTQTKQFTHTVPNLVLATTAHQTGMVLKTTRKLVRPLAAFLRNNSATQAAVLVDIAATDKLDRGGRFSIKYSFLSVTFNRRLTVEVSSNETLSVPSLAAPFFNNQKIFASAG